MTFHQTAFISIGKGWIGVAVDHGLVIGDDRDGQVGDVRSRSIDEDDVIVLEIRSGEHGFVIAGGGDGFVFTGLFGIEVVFDGGVVERDVVAFKDFIHDELIARGDGVAVVGLVMGGETDIDGQRRDGGERCVHERDIVVLEIRAGKHGFVIACSGDGLVRTDILRVEVVFDGGVVELDVVAFENFVHEKIDTLGNCIAIIDLVAGGETDVDGQLRDVRQSRIGEGDFVII